jgi:hypothetical protein
MLMGGWKVSVLRTWKICLWSNDLWGIKMDFKLTWDELMFLEAITEEFDMWWQE